MQMETQWNALRSEETVQKRWLDDDGRSQGKMEMQRETVKAVECWRWIEMKDMSDR